MILLRELKEKDALSMIEWMHDADIQKNFRKDMLNITLEEAKEFCINSKIQDIPAQGASIHFAIVDENDEYLGTVSLKEIDYNNKSAEYAIVTRKKVHGKGIAYTATSKILEKAFYEYGLHRVYLNVLSDNEAAKKLYERVGFKFEGEFKEHLFINGEYKSLMWYGILEKDFCKCINIY